MDVFLTVLLKVVIMLIMMGVGWGVAKAGMLTQQGAGEMTKFLLNIVTPCLIINSFITAESGAISPWSLILAAITAALAMGIAIGISYLFFGKQPEARKKVLRFSIIFSNAGFMGMPLVQGILGDGGVVFGSFYIAVFNFIAWTYGYSMMSNGNKIRIKSILLNPGTIGLCVGLPLYLLGIGLPQIVAEPINSFAALNTPVAMIIVGSNIARLKIKDVFTDKNVYIASLARLIIAPLLLIGVLCIIKPEYNLFMSTTIQASAPVAANCVMFAMLFNQDAGLASKTVTGSTLMSILTIPVIMVIAQFLAGVVL